MTGLGDISQGGVVGSQNALQSSPGDTQDPGEGGKIMLHQRAAMGEALLAALGAGGRSRPMQKPSWQGRQ